MSAAFLLDRLEKVKRTGTNRWQARCPAHADKGPSLSIRELDDGRVLMHCFGGCSTVEVLAAAGLAFDDLFPPKPVDYQTHPERRPWPAADVLRAVAFEALVVAQSAAALLAGEPFGQSERDRLMLAASRINAALTAAGVEHA